MSIIGNIISRSLGCCDDDDECSNLKKTFLGLIVSKILVDEGLDPNDFVGSLHSSFDASASLYRRLYFMISSGDYTEHLSNTESLSTIQAEFDSSDLLDIQVIYEDLDCDWSADYINEDENTLEDIIY